MRLFDMNFSRKLLLLACFLGKKALFQALFQPKNNRFWAFLTINLLYFLHPAEYRKTAINAYHGSGNKFRGIAQQPN